MDPDDEILGLEEEYVGLRAGIRRLLGPRLAHTAVEFEDLYQAAWVAVITSIRKGVAVRNPKWFLIGTILNTWKMELRRRSRNPVGSLESAENAKVVEREASSEPSPLERQLAAERAVTTVSALESLDPRRRDVLRMRMMLGMKPKDIMQRLGLTERQYRRLLQEGTVELQAKLRRAL